MDTEPRTRSKFTTGQQGRASSGALTPLRDTLGLRRRLRRDGQAAIFRPAAPEPRFTRQPDAPRIANGPSADNPYRLGAELFRLVWISPDATPDKPFTGPDISQWRAPPTRLLGVPLEAVTARRQRQSALRQYSSVRPDAESHLQLERTGDVTLSFSFNLPTDSLQVTPVLRATRSVARKEYIVLFSFNDPGAPIGVENVPDGLNWSESRSAAFAYTPPTDIDPKRGDALVRLPTITLRSGGKLTLTVLASATGDAESNPVFLDAILETELLERLTIITAEGA